MDICLEPDVVLFHLKHILGESIHITDEQLNDFIRDLKKLIRHDQRRLSKEEKENSTQLSSTLGPPVSLCKCHARCRSSDETSSSISEEIGSSSRSSSSSDTVVKKPDNLIKQPALSFIKPWRLKPPPKGSKFPGRSDPVNLYKHYEDQWKQVHIPGESGLSRLRWSVRERMLGEDPQPRVTDAEQEGSSESQFKAPDETELDQAAHFYGENDSRFCTCQCCFKSKVPAELAEPEQTQSTAESATDGLGSKAPVEQTKPEATKSTADPDIDDRFYSCQCSLESEVPVEQTKPEATKSAADPDIDDRFYSCQCSLGSKVPVEQTKPEATKSIVDPDVDDRLCSCQCCLRSEPCYGNSLPDQLNNERKKNNPCCTVEVKVSKFGRIIFNP